MECWSISTYNHASSGKGSLLDAISIRKLVIPLVYIYFVFLGWAQANRIRRGCVLVCLCADAVASCVLLVRVMSSVGCRV